MKKYYIAFRNIIHIYYKIFTANSKRIYSTYKFIKSKNKYLILSFENYLKYTSSLKGCGEKELIPWKNPQEIGIKSQCIKYVEVANPYVAELKNAKIYGDSDIIFCDNKIALSDLATHLQFGRFITFQYDRIVESREGDFLQTTNIDYNERTIEKAIMLSGLTTKHYGHWFADYLPKIQFLEQHADFNKLPILINDDMPKSHVSFLRRLCKNDFIFIKRDESLNVKKLLVASSPTFIPAEVISDEVNVSDLPGLSPRSLLFLQAKILLSETPYNGPRKRIFLSRKNSSWRTLLNEEEIFNGLISFGFERVYLEDLDLSEQIKTFQSADFIVGPNGSAFLNIIYAQKDAKILILGARNSFNLGTLQGPMEAVGYHPYFLNTGISDNNTWKHGNYSINTEEVLNAVSILNMQN